MTDATTGEQLTYQGVAKDPEPPVFAGHVIIVNDKGWISHTYPFAVGLAFEVI